jgi:hypothetical protein
MDRGGGFDTKIFQKFQTLQNIPLCLVLIHILYVYVCIYMYVCIPTSIIKKNTISRFLAFLTFPCLSL